MSKLLAQSLAQRSALGQHAGLMHVTTVSWTHLRRPVAYVACPLNIESL
jgi:hypothetical protein